MQAFLCKYSMLLGTIKEGYLILGLDVLQFPVLTQLVMVTLTVLIECAPGKGIM